MMCRSIAFGAVLVIGAACTSNTAPGNDRLAYLDPPGEPAELVQVAAAIEGLDPSLLFPETITDADMATLPTGASTCLFRYTSVGLPVFVYPSDAASAGILKLNGSLITLPPAGRGRFEADGVSVETGALEGEGQTERHEAELVVHLAGSAHEKGFHGYAECGVTPDRTS